MFKDRYRYYKQKVARAWRDGTLAERVIRRFHSSARARAFALRRYATLPAADRRLKLKEGFADRRNTKPQNARSREVLDRITDAYIAAVRDQKVAALPFQPRGLWDEWIAVNYGPLIAAARARDHNALSSLLQNFSRERFSIGTGSCYDDVVHYEMSVFGGLYVRTLWCDYRNKLRDDGVDPSLVTHPDVGNPAGMLIGEGVVPIETLRHAHNAGAMLNVLNSIDRPVIVEIGGGFGGQLYQTLAMFNRSGKPMGMYANFDLPEVLFVASYFVLEALPDANVRLYGEGRVTVDPACGLDVGLYPHFAIDEIPALSADLVLNTNSFAEMDSMASLHYMDVVSKITRRYFMHTNHETRIVLQQQDGSTSTNLLGSELVPDRARFVRVYCRPRKFRRPEDFGYRSFSYLYERMV